MSDSESQTYSEQSDQEDQLCYWITNCFRYQYHVDKIYNRLKNEPRLEDKLEYLSPIHQLFDSYYYLIKQLNQCKLQFDDIDLYLTYILRSQSFQNEISGRCLQIITQTDSIDNLKDKIQLVIQIFDLFKDVDKEVLIQSNVSIIFTMQKIIEIHYPHFDLTQLFQKFDDFLQFLQKSATMFSYQNTPTYPQPLEFIQFSGQSNQIFGKFYELSNKENSLKTYLNYHFNILREDYIYDMRQQISYLSEKGFDEYTDNTGLYQNIRLKSFEINNYYLLWKISIQKFNLDRRRLKTIDWGRSKKLSRGSLICITNVECHPLLFGVITQRSTNQDEYQNFDRINLEFRFLNPKSQILEFLTLLNQKTILFEYQTQIETQIYFLEALKKIEKLPFENLILKNQKQVSIPKYLQNNCCLDIDLAGDYVYSGIKVDPSQSMWHNMKSTLDESQLNAIKLILTKEVSLIQGPPGTGKTYCGLLATKILYENFFKINSPILIVTQTNHALEYFLEGLVKLVSIRNVAKLGGVPKSDAIKDCHFQCKSDIQFSWNDFKDLKKQLITIFQRLSSYDYFISAKDINRYWPELSQKLISEFQSDNVLNSQQIDLQAENLILDSWLDGKCPKVSMLKYRSDLYGMINYFKDSKITNLEQTNNILERNQKEYYYENESDQDIDEFLDSSDEYELDYQFEQKHNEIQVNQNKFNQFYDFQGIEKIQELIQDDSINPWELNYYDIKKIIKYLEYLKSNEDCILFEKTYQQFQEMSQDLKNLYDKEEIKKLSKYKIIGVTVASAARHIQKLQELNIKVLVMEEAAEVLESHTACILMKNLQHLILIGDHLQLSPLLKCYDLKKKQNISVSLFERFYNNQIPTVKLTTQRRMKTKFADFIRLIYGEQYLDDSYVQLNRNNLKIVGLNEDLVFFNHSWLEGEGKKSKINITEAEMITGMVQYLTEVAYQQQQITVLSFYLRQAQLIQKNLIRNKLSKVKVQTVDNYQGEENDIVIISLVRNNSQKKLGFILNNNRINVALSRARIGLYIFGNFDFIKKAAKSDSLWQKIIDMAQAKNCLSKFITLKCLKHGTLRKVYQPNDWLKYQAGCCDKICDYNFEGCYHRCKKECHLSNHQLEKCPEQCGRSLECGHICEQQCIQPCSCTKKILVKLPNCSHEALICCSQDPLQILCQQDLQLTQQNCSHIYNYKCSEKESVDPQCQYECKRVLQCGHICKKKCWQECQPCEDYCETVKYCGHKCYSLCQQPFSSCDQEICIKLDCGRHIIKKSCFQMQNLLMINLNLSPQFFRSQIGQKYLKDLFQRLAIGQRDALQIFNNKAEFECRAPCQKPRECGHIFQCKNLCTEVCTPCGLQIPVTLECGHQYQIFCKNKDAFLNNFQCKKQCTRQYACGHQQKCKQLCFEQCTPCQELVLKHSNCGHSIRTQCFNNYICKKKCTRRRNCGHQDPCLNKCGYECSPCQEIVNWLLVCGHFKEMKCFSTNFECTMPCQRQRTCMHNFPCYNQCSEQCTACQQVILWTLSCGHQIYVQCWVFQAYQQQGLYGDTFQCKICQQNF
ncbi:unnamed protein product (macronuclear) [Paramecium tetraurelia]|uniref:P-loop containing nucleoside triphosphate hydrolase n=1 Tax=Paramecium tetraurelia TaxID=5888 RepID=A0CXX6_PARTE|nr:uncharacterized protein GSPATT00011275001 [Paramecium tetraurelia]CAK75643.1 unnamed protein product [Paramecium tetraurelia]|eukprot:XP_001443040.1 hypothetical protein (macronuclear) [Paramecium tetraurelia strain d4-2]